MSATNWDKCPMCKLKKEKQYKKLEDVYGKVPQDEYEKIRKALEEECYDDDNETTLREDYECYVDSKGNLNINYGGHCDSCGSSWEFKKFDIPPK